MDTKKILIGAGACTLAVAGFFASKANTKFASVNVFYKKAGTTCTQFGTLTNWTSGGPGTTSVIKTVAGATQTIYSDASCATPLSIVHLK